MQPSWTGGSHQQQRYNQQYAIPQQQQQPSTAYLAPQATGYNHGGGYMQPQPPAMLQQQQPQFTAAYPQQPQMTGYPQQLGSFQGVPSVFSNAFMPGNVGGVPSALPQVFAQQNMATYGNTQVNVQWALTEDEKKSYSQIFRNWQDDRGFISGSRAQQVFKESGLDREDLMKIWALSDVNDRGQLDLPEFQVAMGLIYRKLSGNPIPDVLPQEMIPPSSRDLESSVDFLKDLLRNDTRSRSTNLDASQSNGSSNVNNNKYAKVRSFDRNASPEPSSTFRNNNNRKDAAVYKHDDAEVRTYKPNSRHLDRRNVRFHGEDDDNSDLGSLKKQLKDTQNLLDRTFKTKGEDEDEDDDDDDDELKGEIEELKYRIRRVQEDIEFNKSGRRTEAKDDERRRLERELLFLMHDKMPELEDKMREKERKRRDRERSAAKQRDSRNSRTKYDRGYSSRSSSKNNRDSSGSDNDGDDNEQEQEDRGYLRGSYGAASSASTSRQPERVRSPMSRNSRESRDGYDNDSKHKRAPSPPPLAAAGTSTPWSPPPVPSAPPASTASPVLQPKKPQTAEERQAFIRAEAQRRVQERMRMLTGHSPAASPEPTETLQPGYDSSLQARLEQDRREAAKRAEDDDKAASERERLRQIKLEEERQSKLRAEQGNVREEAQALQKVSNEVTASEVRNHLEHEETATSAARDELAREEQRNKEREQVLAAQQQQSQARMEQLKSSFQQKPKTPPQPPASRGAKAPPKPPVSRKQAPPPPTSHSSSLAAPSLQSPAFSAQASGSSSSPTASSVPAQAPPPPPLVAPPAPPPPTAPSAQSKVASPPTNATSSSSPAPKATSSTNPFHRLAGASGTQAGQSPSPSSAPPKGANNPFFRPPTGAATAANPPPPVAEPVPQKPQVARKEDDWGDASQSKQTDSDDSDDEDEEGGPSVKQMRAGLAGLLFGGPSSSPSAPPSRPSSTRPDSSPTSAAPKSPAHALPPLGAAAGSPPPRAALLGAIQSGARLRKATTIDRSVVQGAGHILPSSGEAGTSDEHREAATPLLRNKASSPVVSNSESVATSNEQSSSTAAPNGNRQSVDWYGGLAADHYPSPTVQSSSETVLPKVAEDVEEEDDNGENAKTDKEDVEKPHITQDTNADEDPNAFFDMSASTKVRSLYPYQGQRSQDATFEANFLIVAHPPKDPASDWLYGIVPATGSRGWLPRTYVEELAFNIPSTVLYDFEGATEDELKVSAGTQVFVCDKVDADWVRVVLNGHVGLVPSAYIEEDTAQHSYAKAEEKLVNSSKEGELSEPASRGIIDPVEVSSSSEDESDEEPDSSTEKERLHILEAAGLVVQHSDTKKTHRRPPPPRPRASSIRSLDPTTSGLPPSFADTPLASVDDAYARWQAIQLDKARPTSQVSAQEDQGNPSVSSTATINDSLHDRVRQQPESADTHLSPDIGKTWSSLIDQDALQSIPEKARKRQEAIFELIKSEETFLESLQTVVREWFTKLQPLLPHEASLVIFANIEDILLWSATFLSDLDSRQKECRLYVDRIGDILKAHTSGLDVYRPYCLNQIRIHGLNLEHYLLEPMQRLARYPLLFGQILRYTDEDDPDTVDLKLAIRNAQQVLARTNEQMRQQETGALLAYLSENLVFPDDESLSIDLAAATRYGTPRRLVKEGDLVKGYSHHRQSKRKELHAYLFSDMLLLTTKSLNFRGRLSSRAPVAGTDALYIYKTPIPLDEVLAQSGSDERLLTVKYRDEVLKLQAGSAKQRDDWVRSIVAAKAQLPAAN